VAVGIAAMMVDGLRRSAAGRYDIVKTQMLCDSTLNEQSNIQRSMYIF